MTGSQKRAQLWLIYDQTTSLTGTATTYATLLAALQAMTAGTVSLFSTGTISRTFGNGFGAEYFPASEYQAGPEAYAGIAGEFRDLYELSKTVLINSGIASPSDLQIWQEMMSRLTPVRELGPSDFSAIRMVGA